jgi:hypothetical protein
MVDAFDRMKARQEQHDTLAGAFGPAPIQRCFVGTPIQGLRIDPVRDHDYSRIREFITSKTGGERKRSSRLADWQVSRSCGLRFVDCPVFPN